MTASTHWARVVAETFAPTRKQLIAEALQEIEDKYDSPQDIELVAMIRAAHAKAAETEPAPLPPLEEAVAAERARLEAMTVAEMVAERAEGARWLRAAIEEAEAVSAAEERRIRMIYGKTPELMEDLL